MTEDLAHRGTARGDRDARTHRTSSGAVALEQSFDARDDFFVASSATGEGAVAVVVLLAAVDRNADAEAMGREELDHIRGQECGVGRQREPDRPSLFGSFFEGVLRCLANDVDPEQGFSTEVRDREFRPATGLSEEEVDGLMGRLGGHLGCCGQLAELVLAVLVTVGAGEVAAAGDVEHQGCEGEGHRREVGRGSRRFTDRAQQAKGHQFLEALAFFLAFPGRNLRTIWLGKTFEQTGGHAVQSANGGGARCVDERFAGGFKRVVNCGLVLHR